MFRVQLPLSCRRSFQLQLQENYKKITKITRKLQKLQELQLQENYKNYKKITRKLQENINYTKITK